MNSAIIDRASDIEIAPSDDTVFDTAVMIANSSPTAPAIASAIFDAKGLELVHRKGRAPESHQ